MAFNYPASGTGWRLAGSLDQLAAEVTAAHPDFTCLGTIGDQSHVSEGYQSDHNPFIKGPDGLGIVRAIDIGGPDGELKQLRQHIWDLYGAQDNRLYQFGYAKGCSDNLINNWGLPLRSHVDTGDAGHLHISVTQANGNSPSPSGYVAAIDDRRSWGIASGVAPASNPNPTPIAPDPGPQMGDWPSNIIPPHQYFGLISGPAASHGGYYANEQIYVEAIQLKLVKCGFAGNVGRDWSDGKFEQPTADAVTRFQHAHMPGTQFYGQVWSDDWAKLRSL